MDRVARVLAQVEGVIYAIAGVLLAATALLILGHATMTFVTHVSSQNVVVAVIELLGELLLALMAVELLYTVNHEQAAQDTDLNGIYLLVAGGPMTELDDASLLQEWKGQYKVEHCFRLTNQVFLVGPVFLKSPIALSP